LRQPQPARSFREIQRFANSYKISQMAQFHDPPIMSETHRPASIVMIRCGASNLRDNSQVKLPSLEEYEAEKF
jgi:hypothetical protein